MELTAIPLFFVCFIVLIKVICLRKQRMYLWVGFIVCLIAQFVVIGLLGDELFNDSKNFDSVEQCLFFIPSATFGLAVDV